MLKPILTSTRSSILLALSLLLVLLAFWLNLSVLRQALRTNQVLIHTYEVLSKISKVRERWHHLQHGQKSPASDDQALQSHLAELHKLVTDNPSQQHNFARLLQALKQASPEPVLQAMESQERRLLNLRSREADSATKRRLHAFQFVTGSFFIFFPIALGSVYVESRSRKRAERARRESEARHRDLFQRAPCGYHSLDAQGRYVEVNNTELEWTGYSRDQLIGQPFANFLRPSQIAAFEASWQKLQQHGSDADLELDFRKAAGSYLPISLQSTAIFSDQGNFLTARVLMTEVGFRQKLETELRQARNEALELARAKAEFLSTMSHEIRTPLQGILGTAQLLEDCNPSSEAAEFSETIRKSAQSLVQIVNQVLDLSKQEASGFTTQFVNTDLEEFMETCLDRVSGLLLDKNLSLYYSYEVDCPKEFRTDPTRLSQVLVNLLGNALKFTENGEVSLRAKVSPGCIEFCVTDTGPGLSQEQQARLFLPFQQLDESTSKTKGTGLGLSISKKIVNSLGGQIILKSEPGVGSRFLVQLPLEKPGLARVLPASPARRILVLENHKGEREALVDYLARLGYQVVEAAPYDLAIVGEHSPGSSQTLLPDKPRWRWTRQAAEPGWQGFLRKPLRLSQLYRRLQDLWQTQHPEAQPSRFDSSLAQRCPLEILIADDVPILRSLLRQTLAKFGYSCREAENGQQVMELLEESPAQVLLLDLQMPVQDGYAVLSQLDGWNPKPYVVAVSANTLNQTERGWEYPPQATLLKPFQAEELAEVLIEAYTKVGLPPLQGTQSDPPLPSPLRGETLDRECWQRLQSLGPDLVRELLQAARLDFHIYLEDLRQAKPSVPAAAHRFKGAARSMGAFQLAELLERAEMGDEIDWHQLRACFEQTLAVFKDLSSHQDML